MPAFTGPIHTVVCIKILWHLQEYRQELLPLQMVVTLIYRYQFVSVSLYQFIFCLNFLFDSMESTKCLTACEIYMYRIITEWTSNRCCIDLVFVIVYYLYIRCSCSLCFIHVLLSVFCSCSKLQRLQILYQVAVVFAGCSSVLWVVW